MARKFLVQYIKEYTQKQGFSRLVVGLSGGLDSTVVAYLATEALGRSDCIGVLMPHKVSDPSSLTDALVVAEKLGIRTREVDISPLVDPFISAFPGISQLQLGNIMARCRMIVLYQISAEEKALVAGTSNKSEILLGYGTLYGDLACAFDPLGDLYKTQVRALAEALDVPENIRKKAPSADLWSGQSDEGELGLTYADVDRFLMLWVDNGYTREKLLAEGFDAEYIDRIVNRVNSQQFKRRIPPIPHLSDIVSGTNRGYAQDRTK